MASRNISYTFDVFSSSSNKISYFVKLVRIATRYQVIPLVDWFEEKTINGKKTVQFTSYWYEPVGPMFTGVKSISAIYDSDFTSNFAEQLENERFEANSATLARVKSEIEIVENQLKDIRDWLKLTLDITNEVLLTKQAPCFDKSGIVETIVDAFYNTLLKRTEKSDLEIKLHRLTRAAECINYAMEFATVAKQQVGFGAVFEVTAFGLQYLQLTSVEPRIMTGTRTLKCFANAKAVELLYNLQHPLIVHPPGYDNWLEE